MAKNNLSKIFKDLEKITLWFEGEDIDLEEGLKKYEEGINLVKEAQKQLTETENKLKKIK